MSVDSHLWNLWKLGNFPIHGQFVCGLRAWACMRLMHKHMSHEETQHSRINDNQQLEVGKFPNLHTH
jgi:hypothetical protein